MCLLLRTPAKLNPQQNESSTSQTCLDCSGFERWACINNPSSFASIQLVYIFSFKFPSNWSLRGLFLSLICAFRKKTNQANNQQSGQCIVFLMGFSKHSGSSKPDYLLAAKPYNNFNPIVFLIALLSWMSCWSPCRWHTRSSRVRTGGYWC